MRNALFEFRLQLKEIKVPNSNVSGHRATQYLDEQVLCRDKSLNSIRIATTCVEDDGFGGQDWVTKIIMSTP